MKILVDLTACMTKEAGVTIAAFRILRVWKECKHADAQISFLVRECLEDTIKMEFPGYDYIVLKTFTYTNRFQSFFKYKAVHDIISWIKTINNHDCDILYSPSANAIFFQKTNKYKIQVIHDLQGIKVTKGKERWINKLFIPLVLRNSNKIITISKFVKQDILNTYHIVSKDNIKVIYNAVSVIQEPFLIPSELKIEYKYLLYVGALCEYKNIITLIKAFITVEKRIPHKLIVVGKKTSYWESVIMPVIKSNMIENRVIYFEDYLSDEYMAYLYRSADLFISPSLHEGFGFSPVEAAIYETPVISTKETALYETTMGLVNYYTSPLDYIQLGNKIIDVLDNYPSKEKLKTISMTLKEQYNDRKQGKEVYDYIIECAKK